MAAGGRVARRWLVRGRVQGVGFRNYVQRAAANLALTGYARNLDDGRVEVYAAGTEEDLSQLARFVHQGPRWAEVHAVEEQEAEVRSYSAFLID
ncbi:MAG: acylphosphatase [Terriglobia bacterium]|nr:MAG: acylphosphatase [Terriglobia bacterium]